MRIYDISLPIYNGMPVYPGNPTVVIEPHHVTPRHQTNLSRLRLGSHTGTHVDTPHHAFSNKAGLEAFSLEQLIGRARVIDASQSEKAVKLSDIDLQAIKKGERLLFKTRNSARGFNQFYDDYVYLDGDLAESLASKQVKLVGIDSLSVKQRGGKDVRPHTALLKRNIVIIEGLDLSSVGAGEYFLVTAPLKIRNIDGAPARVFLIEDLS